MHKLAFLVSVVLKLVMMESKLGGDHTSLRLVIQWKLQRLF